MSKTPFSSKCEILGQLWVLHKDEPNNPEGWQKFFSYCDLALPLAYMVYLDITPEETISEVGIQSVDEAFDILCDLLQVEEDVEYSDIEDIFQQSPYNLVM